MLQFLGQDLVASEIKKLALNAKRIRLAVAFWGSNAVERLGLDTSTAEVKVICDLYSGAVNPAEIRKLMKRNGTHVRTRQGLHSKVYLFDDEVVVLGSSNASVNGLGTEDDELTSRVEANVLTRDPTLVQRVAEWFDGDLWNTGDTVEVRDQDLKEAKRLWECRRRDRPEPIQGVLARAIHDPAVARGRQIYVIWYRGEVDDAEKVLKRKKKETGRPSLDLFGHYDRMPDNGVLVSWSADDGKVTFDDLWVRDRGDALQDEPGYMFVLPYKGMRKPKGPEWTNAVKRFVNATSTGECDGEVIPLETFVSKYGPNAAAGVDPAKPPTPRGSRRLPESG